MIPTAPLREEEPSGVTPSDDSDVLSLVWQSAANITFENIAVRADGGLVLTATDHGGVNYTKAPTGNPPKLTDDDFPGYIEIPDVTSTLGIAEVSENFFIVAANNYSLNDFKGVEGSFSV